MSPQQPTVVNSNGQIGISAFGGWAFFEKDCPISREEQIRFAREMLDLDSRPKHASDFQNPSGLLRTFLSQKPTLMRITRRTQLTPLNFHYNELRLLGQLSYGKSVVKAANALGIGNHKADIMMRAIASRLQLPCSPTLLATIATMSELVGNPHLSQEYISTHPILQPRPLYIQDGKRQKIVGCSIYGSDLFFNESAPLSERIKEVIVMRLLGYTREETAKEFTLSLNTVKSHLHNAKLRSTSSCSLLYNLLTANSPYLHIANPIMPGLVRISSDNCQYLTLRAHGYTAAQACSKLKIALSTSRYRLRSIHLTLPVTDRWGLLTNVAILSGHIEGINLPHFLPRKPLIPS